MIKIATFFLIGMLVLGMFGKLRMPRRLRHLRDRARLGRPAKCPHCGRYRIGKGPCPCQRR